MNQSNTSLTRRIRKHIPYYILLILPMIYFVIFRYGPILGNVLAFRRYMPGQSVYGVEWVGLKYFQQFLRDPAFWNAFKNTLILSVLNILISFSLPIIFALMVTEIARPKLKNVVQTISYFPHFISTVVVVGMLSELLSPSSGAVNNILAALGHERIFFMNEASYFRPIYILSEIWQHLGWNSIIYCVALVGIDPQLYEAADIDGAGRMRQVLSISLPLIAPTIAVVLVITLGSVMSVGFEKVLLMYTPSNSSTSDILDTFVYRTGIEKSSYSFATAVGLFSGLIGCILVTSTNWLSKKITGSSLY